MPSLNSSIKDGDGDEKVFLSFSVLQVTRKIPFVSS